MNYKEYEERMKNPKYKELEITNCESNKEYVFISYRGNSWKKVLTDIVYRLQKQYNLRIYFDKEFASENYVWVDQFKRNMDSKNCKAVLCFFDEGYVTSYATLLELMHAMNPRSKLSKSIFSINFPIDWKKLDDCDYDTPLGNESQDNPAWKRELDSFKYEFELLKKKDDYQDISAYYNFDPNTKLRACDCKDIIAILQPQNKREYSDTEEYYMQFIIDPLKKVCPGVFSDGDEVNGGLAGQGEKLSIPKKKNDEKRVQNFDTDIVKSDIELITKREKIDEQDGYISLKDFLKTYNNNNFKKNTYESFRLIGQDEFSKYSTGYYDSAFDLTWNFVMKLLSERGIEVIRTVTACHPNMKNPVFIEQSSYNARDDQNKYRKIEVSGLENYYMYRHYGQYDWIYAVLRPRMLEVGFPLEKFGFQYKGNKVNSDSETKPMSSGEPVNLIGGNQRETILTGGGGTTGPVSLDEGKGVEKLEGQYSLREFLAKYDNKTFQSKSCNWIKLIGKERCEKFTMNQDEKGNEYETARQLVFSFAMKRLDEMGMGYINAVNAGKTSKNPIFITEDEHNGRKARKESVTYKKVTSSAVSGYSMCTHYSEYDWLNNSFIKQITALGCRIDDFDIVLG